MKKSFLTLVIAVFIFSAKAQTQTPVDTTICSGTIYEFYDQTGTNLLLTIDVDHPLTDSAFLYGASGAEDTLYLTLNFYPTYSHTDAVTIYEMNLPYTYGTRTFPVGTVTGNYNVTLKSINGCDSIIDLSLTVNPLIVSTIPANKNVVIEEFTGGCCGYCPDGHRRANEIVANNPNRVWTINIHSGSYSNSEACERRLRSDDGTIIHDYFKPSGYPIGTVNRGTLQGRDAWNSTTNSRLGEPSCLNVASKGTINWATRELTLLVEVYYTGNSSVSQNYLTVALLQNNIDGTQSGASGNPAQNLPNGQYRHMHALRDIISPVWGDTITTTSTGSFFTKTYIYPIPDKINTVDVLLEDLELIAFVSETQKTVISATKATINHENQPELDCKISLNEVSLFGYIDCSTENGIYIDIKNRGIDTIKSISYNLLKENTPILSNQTWNKRNILFGKIDTVSISKQTIVPNAANTYTLEITKINDKDTVFRPQNLVITKNIVEVGGNMKFKIVTDQYADYTSFVIYNPSGNSAVSGGPWTRLTSPGTTERLFDFNPSSVGCYTLFVEDQYGAGINKGYGAGYFELLASDGSRLFYNDGKFGSVAKYSLYVTTPASVKDFDNNKNIVIFPNPANDYITIVSDVTIERVEIYNMQGQLVKTEQMNISSISISDLASGIYSVRIITPAGIATKKFVKQ